MIGRSIELAVAGTAADVLASAHRWSRHGANHPGVLCLRHRGMGHKPKNVGEITILNLPSSGRNVTEGCRHSRGRRQLKKL
jgi:hypothetical protein